MTSIYQTPSLKNVKFFCNALELLFILIFEVWVGWLFYCFFYNIEPTYFLDKYTYFSALNFANISAFSLIIVGSIIVLRTWLSFRFCLKTCYTKLCHIFKNIFYYFLFIYFLIGAFLPNFTNKFPADQHIICHTKPLVLFIIVMLPVTIMLIIERNFWNLFSSYVKIRTTFIMTHLVFTVVSPAFSVLFSFIALPFFIFVRE